MISGKMKSENDEAHSGASLSGRPEKPGFEAAEQLRIVLVGHEGRMGRMLRQRLEAAGHEVRGVDRSSCDGEMKLNLDALAMAVQGTDIVLISVPVSAMEHLVGQLASLLQQDQLLMDITSVKTLPMRWMEDTYKGPVIGTHPLFGPCPTPEQLRVILVRGSAAEEKHCRAAESLYTSMGCTVEWATADEHDCGVALSQSLNFAVSASFFCLLASSPDMLRFLTPSFTRHLEAARKHLTEDTDMFCEFTAYNPCFPEAVERFAEVIGSAASGDLPKIASEAASWYKHCKV